MSSGKAELVLKPQFLAPGKEAARRRNGFIGSEDECHIGSRLNDCISVLGLLIQMTTNQCLKRAKLFSHHSGGQKTEITGAAGLSSL